MGQCAISFSGVPIFGYSKIFGDFLSPNFFDPKQYLACASSKICEFITYCFHQYQILLYNVFTVNKHICTFMVFVGFTDI